MKLWFANFNTVWNLPNLNKVTDIQYFLNERYSLYLMTNTSSKLITHALPKKIHIHKISAKTHLLKLCHLEQQQRVAYVKRPCFLSTCFIFFTLKLLFSLHTSFGVFLTFSFILSCQYTRNTISYPFELKTRKRSKDEYTTISFPQKTENGRTVTTLMWGLCSARSVILDFMNPLKPDVHQNIIFLKFISYPDRALSTFWRKILCFKE